MRQEPLFQRTKGHIGTDESGKGDYFGPLVAAGVFVPEGQDDVLRELGVRDSKKISDKRVREIAETIKLGFVHSVVAIGPDKYNSLYEKMRNLNRMLAWAHARVIENILAEVDCGQVVTDQFGDEMFVRNALMKKGKDIELIQRTKAEDDPAVAAASILARAEFLKRLYFLGQDAGMDLPKGASNLVEEAACRLVREKGENALALYAKLHFKTTKKILAAV
ncbi:MAG: ribonuclease HIII [Acidobacteria bacterium]|nr:ribonuclease HIII [Acidobacteriota bacterium]MCG2814588.1 ribonuclease HIII [Candidatus Aminicenantes bacterium]MBU1475541.1 ribonuclease HIII [Acidobacteriota bacterium]MBU2438935.1 ribonuclease HIII [Acidobacteriota bacterium]MBU4204060.1 ribonuclease HIII [Acidobacteriota bacterium]